MNVEPQLVSKTKNILYAEMELKSQLFLIVLCGEITEDPEAGDECYEGSEEKERKEIMRWIMSFIETNKEAWERRRKEEVQDREQQEDMRQWRLLTNDQKIRKLREEEEEASKSSKPGKEERLETVRKLKKIWKKREEEVEHKEEPEKEATPEEEEAIVKELEDQELIESGEFLETGPGLCLSCLMSPC